MGSRRYVQRHRGNWVSSSDVSLPVRRRECAHTVHVTGVKTADANGSGLPTRNGGGGKRAGASAHLR